MLDTIGLGVGTLQLDFPGRVFHPGDTIRGTVSLKLDEPVLAKRLVVGLDAKQRSVGLASSSSQGLALSYRRDTVFDFHLDLDRERAYQPGETHRFELMVPERALETSFGLPSGTLGDIAQAISFLSPTKRFPLEWRVFAFLDRPWRINPKAEVPIQLREPDTKPKTKPKTKPTPKAKRRPSRRRAK